MKNFKSWLVTLAVLLCSAAVNASEFSYIVSEADGLLNDTVEVQGVRKFQYTSPKYTLDEPTNVLYFTFLKGVAPDGIAAYEHSGYPYVALAEFCLYDGDGNKISLTVDNFDTNAQEESEQDASISNICDGDTTSHWHSRWSGSVNEFHYLKVTLPEGKDLSEFSFSYITRYINHGNPGCIQISSSPEIGNHNVSGECGENLEWIYSTASRELTIKGNGNMPKFESRTDVPWMGFVVESVVIEEGVTSIGKNAFTDFSRLTTITLSANDPDSLTFDKYTYPFGQYLNSLIIVVPGEAYDDYVASSNWEYYQSCFRIASEMPRYTHTDDNGVTWGYHYVYSINSLCIDSISNYTTELVFPACLPYMDGELPVGRVEFTIRENEDLVSVDLSATAITNVGSEKLGEDWYGNSSLNFYGCHSLETVLFPATLETIGCETFTDCHSLESINWTNLTSLKEIADRAFRIDNWDYNFMNITSIDLSSTQLTTIGRHAFDSFENLQEIKFPSSLKDIGSFALYRCFQLKEVNLSHTQVTTIHERTFEYCSSIQSVNLPTSLTEIKLYAFNGANSLSTIDLSNVQVIGESAFRDCHNLHNIDLSSVTSVGITAFTHDLNVTIESNTPASIKTSSFTQNTKFFITPNAYDAFCSAQNWANWANNICMYEVDADGVKWGYSYLKDSNSMRVIFAIDYGTEVTVPSTVSYKDTEVPVTQIDSICFRGYNIVSIVLPTTLSNIESGTFRDCRELTSIDIPASVETIGDNAFSDCAQLATVTFAANSALQTIGSYAFSSTKLTSIDIPAAVETIGVGAFNGCSQLATVTFEPNSMLQTIGNYAFCNTKVTSVDIPASVETIGDSAFGYCGQLATVTFETGSVLQSIGGYIFYGCSELASIEIPASVTSIGESAFANFVKLTTVTFEPNSMLQTIGNNAFNNTKIASVDIPASVETIGDGAFGYCEQLANVTFELNSTLKTIGGSAFTSTKLSSIEIPASVETIDESAFSSCNQLETVAFESNSMLQSIGNNAFNNTKIASVDIPASVETIGDGAFGYCSRLATVTFESNSTLKTIGNNAFHMTRLASIEIPASVTGIGNFAFSNCEKLVKVDFSKSAINILSESLFDYCYGLKEVVLPQSLTEIQSRVFASCHQLSKINMPGSVKNIGSHAFESCNSIKSLDLSKVEIIGEFAFRYTSLSSVDLSSATSIGEEAFTSDIFFNINNQNPALIGNNAFTTSSTFLVPGTAINDYRAANVWSNYASRIFASNIAVQTVNVTAASNTSAIQQAVGGPGNLTSIIDLKVIGTINSYDIIALHDKMIELRYLDLSEARVVANPYPYYGGMYCTEDDVLGPNSFREHHNLISIKLPANIKSIGSHAFYECHNLTEVIIPNSVRHIEEHAFANCSSLQTIVLPNQLESIGWYAFAWGGLKEISFPTTLTTIENGAFQSSQLEIVRLPSSLRYVRDEAFNYCNNLKEVYTYTIQPTAINEKTFSNFKTARLYVPVASGENYYWDEGWKRFTNVAEFDEEYEYFYLDKDHTLDESTGAVDGTPDADLNPGSGLIVEEEVEQNMSDLHIHQNGNCSGSIIAGSTEGNVSTENLHIHINVESGRWYFFCFPFDLNKENISFDNESTQYVFRSYDGSKRAEGNSGWKNVTEENGKYLKAAEGYIFQCSQSDVLTISLAGVKFKKENKYNELVAHVAANMQDASWNFVGNPYLSYYDMADLGYDAPITVWNGYTYEAINPGDDDYQLAPFEAFFVQKPEGTSAIAYSGDDQTTYQGSQAKAEAARARRRTQAINPERLLVNITISNGEKTDRTRIVFNNNVSMGYEMSCDAAKFEAAGVPQLYTIDSRAVKYAINERPVAEGIVTLGYSVPVQGNYTLAAPRMDTPVSVKDNLTGAIHNFGEGDYEFASEAGVFEDRFTVIMKAGETSIDNTDLNDQDSEIYNVKGQRVNSASEQGVYIKNNRKVVIK